MERQTIKIGFTGTQKGLTDLQKTMLKCILEKICQYYDVEEIHHGDCIGADEEIDEICRIKKRLLALSKSEAIFFPTVVIHPPTYNAKRAFCNNRGNSVILQEKSYLARNHDIVDDTDMLIAISGNDSEVLRSGTWATIRYAKKKEKRIIIIYPNSRTEIFKDGELLKEVD